MMNGKKLTIIKVHNTEELNSLDILPLKGKWNKYSKAEEWRSKGNY